MTIHTDSASELHELLEKLLEIISRQYGDGNIISVHALYNSFDKISQIAGYDNYINFVQSFIALCNRVEGDINLLSFKREEIRTKYKNRVREIKSVFEAKNFSTDVGSVFQKHFSHQNLEALVEISDRFEGSHIETSSLEELLESVDSAEKMLKLAADCGVLNERLQKVIFLHLNHLKEIMSHYENFGEVDFWDHYKILFATFSQLIGSLEKNDAPKYGEGLRQMLNHVISGSSFASNVVTIAGPVIALLPK